MTIGVDRHGIERIHRLKLLTAEIRAGRSKRKYKIVKSDSPDDLVFQRVKDGKPMRDNNILMRFIKLARRKVGFLPNERSNRIGRNAHFQAKGPKRAQHLLLDGAVAVRDHEHPTFIRVFGGNVNDIGQSSGRRENPSATLDQLRVVRESVVISAVGELF